MLRELSVIIPAYNRLHEVRRAVAFALSQGVAMEVIVVDDGSDKGRPQDERLRRLEDFDWLLRWSLGGGGLETHPVVAAAIARGPRARPEPVEAAAAAVLSKHSDATPALQRRMMSYLQLEIGVSRFA